MEALERYGITNAARIPKKGIAFYDRIGRDGITDHAVRNQQRGSELYARWNERLALFLLGDTLTIIDIACMSMQSACALAATPCNGSTRMSRLVPAPQRTTNFDGIALTSELSNDRGK